MSNILKFGLDEVGARIFNRAFVASVDRAFKGPEDQELSEHKELSPEEVSIIGKNVTSLSEKNDEMGPIGAMQLLVAISQSESAMRLLASMSKESEKIQDITDRELKRLASGESLESINEKWNAEEVIQFLAERVRYQKYIPPVNDLEWMEDSELLESVIKEEQENESNILF